MLDFLIKYQRFLMLFLQGACFFVAFLILITSNLCPKRKFAIFWLEISAVAYLGAPIIHLSYDGFLGNWARQLLYISKSVDYLAPLFMLFSFNIYLRDLFSHKSETSKRNSLLLISAEIVLLIGVILFVVSRFTGWYFFYDELNHYHWAKGRIIATIIPAVCMILQIILISLNYKTISQTYPNATILFTDIVGFTKMNSEMTAEETVSMLNELVSLFDKRATNEGIEKIKIYL